ncbi:DUF3961 domain-containing protein [Ectobacillus polymachus]|uniref:DUF3961 domain-containing protein n=1 Tax=Ectobacillus polymachus TaxID=1508806 RepID=UPI003A8427B8
MKAAWNQSVALPSHYTHEKTNKKVKARKLIQRLDAFFGLETKGDRYWFYGFYGISFTILFVLIVVLQIMDAFMK